MVDWLELFKDLEELPEVGLAGPVPLAITIGFPTQE